MDLTLGPQHPCKALGKVVHACDPGARRQRQANFWYSLASQPHLVSKPQVLVKEPISKTKVHSFSGIMWKTSGRHIHKCV